VSEASGLVKLVCFDAIAGERVRFDRAASVPLERVAFVSPRRQMLARAQVLAFRQRDLRIGRTSALRVDRETSLECDQLRCAAADRHAREVARGRKEVRSQIAFVAIDVRAMCECREMCDARGGDLPRGRALAIRCNVECDLMGVPKALHGKPIAAKVANDKP